MSRDNGNKWSLVFNALADEQRRELLRYLAQTTGASTVTEVAEHLLDESFDASGGERARLTAMLYHIHLPKLADAELLVWDPSQNMVALTPLAYRLPVGVLDPQPTIDSNTGLKEAGD